MRGINERIGVAVAAIAAATLTLSAVAGAEEPKSRTLKTPTGAAQMVTKPAQKVEKPTVDGRAPERAPDGPSVDQKRAPDGMRWVVLPDGSLGAVPKQAGPNAAAMNDGGVSLECLCRLSKADHCTFTVDAGGDIAKCGGDGTGCEGGDGDHCFWVPGPSPRFGGKAQRTAQ